VDVRTIELNTDLQVGVDVVVCLDLRH